jgi:anti-sigma factor RsiW
MNKTIIAGLIATSTLIASPAAAQTTATGTVNITGSVGEKCQVVNGSTASGNFSSTVALGELAQSNGLLRTDLASTFNAAGAASLTFRVVCTTAAPKVALNATEITAATAAPTGYANRIDYKAKATFSLVGSSQDVENDSAIDALATGATLSDRLAASGTNVAITASNFRTPGASDVLVADNSYAGQIVVVVSPN